MRTLALTAAFVLVLAGTATAQTRTINLPSMAAEPLRTIAGVNGPPALLPARIIIDSRGPVTATSGTITPSRYAFRIEGPGCNGARACTVARYIAVRGKTAPRGPVRVTLTRGIAGRITPSRCGASCTLPRIQWRQRGVTYTIEGATALKGPEIYAMVHLANMAIRGGDRARVHRTRIARTPLRSASSCSASGDVCTGIELASGRIVIRQGLMARYYNRSQLCVRYPSGQVSCRVVPVVRAGETWRAQAAFPVRGPGVYRVGGDLAFSGVGVRVR